MMRAALRSSLLVSSSLTIVLTMEPSATSVNKQISAKGFCCVHQPPPQTINISTCIVCFNAKMRYVIKVYHATGPFVDNLNETKIEIAEVVSGVHVQATLRLKLQQPLCGIHHTLASLHIVRVLEKKKATRELLLLKRRICSIFLDDPKYEVNLSTSSKVPVSLISTSVLSSKTSAEKRAMISSGSSSVREFSKMSSVAMSSSFTVFNCGHKIDYKKK